MSFRRKERPFKVVKGGTLTTKKHRFESFNQRIVKLDIDPIRRARHQDIQNDDLSTATSHFKSSLSSWKDLNLSKNFANFVQEVEPWCDSLAQILHYSQKLMNTLVKYIEKKDSLSLEPLLDLLSHFAHDLGARFEVHFSKAIILVTTLAASHGGVEVIEWSFTCIAWLFKYLSRLLVSDLRPLYDIMAPLLGKASQKTHITRFAAEAMSFLIRKTAISFQKNNAPLKIILEHISNDLESEKDHDTLLYQYGIMTLLSDSIKGIQRGLHSCGFTVYQCLLDAVMKPNTFLSSAFQNILYGITINLIHHTDAESFTPVLSIIHTSIRENSENLESKKLSIYGELLFISATVRKGSRILDWKSMIDSLHLLVGKITNATDRPSTGLSSIEKAAAMILQFSSLDLVISSFGHIIRPMTQNCNVDFLTFSVYFSDLGKDRFRSLLAPYFFKYVNSNWKEKELLICASIAEIVADDRDTTYKFDNANVMCPGEWQQHIAMSFEDARTDDSILFRCSAYLHMMDYFLIDDQCTKSIIQSLKTMITNSVHTDAYSDQRVAFIFGVGLETLLRFDPMWAAEDQLLWPHLCQVSASLGRIPLFLKNLLHLCEVSRADLANSCLDDLTPILTKNLSCPHHSVRLLSLQLFNSLYTRKNHHQADILMTAIAIENTPLTLQSARLASMHIRNLSGQYKSYSSEPWLSNLIPYYCFGLLNFKLSQVWEDAVEAIKVICETKTGEMNVAELAFSWLTDGFKQADQTSSPKLKGDLPQQHLNQFECSELTRIRKLVDKRFQESVAAIEQLRESHDACHESLSYFIPEAASRALKVLTGIPQIAEKHSRSLVPLFLKWSTTEQNVEETTVVDGVGSNLDLSILNESSKHGKLPRQDQKAMLDLFGHFVNPRVLFRSSEVYNALLGLLTNGDVEIQKSALKAIFTWKSNSIQPYQENLMNILDDARFREEISVFLQADSEESTIQSTHRQELMPVLLRLLYGKIIARSGSAGGRRLQSTKRKAVLEALSRFSEADLREFIQITLGPLADLPLTIDFFSCDEAHSESQITIRRQYGLVNMMDDMLEILGSQLKFITRQIAGAILWCTIRSARKLSILPDSDKLHGAIDEQCSLLRSIRQAGLRCLTMLFQRCQKEELSSYMNPIFEDLINPRIEKLPIETAQSVSGLLRLFAVWATSSHMSLYFADHNPALLKIIIDCLEVGSAKDEVKLFVIEEILKPLIALVDPAKVIGSEVPNHRQLIQTQVLNPNIDHVLERAGELLRKSPGKELLGSTISLVSQLAPVVTSKSHILNLLEVSTFLLDQPSQRVSPKSKGDLLRTIQHFVPLADLSESEALQHHLYNTVSSLFGYFKDRNNRVVLSEVLVTLAQDDADLLEVAHLCLDLNAFSSRSIDEPDFDKRLKAFTTLNESAYLTLSVKQWSPLVYNMLFYVKDNEELAIRTNASYALRRYIETNPFRSQVTGTGSSDLLTQVLLSALRKGASERSEFVRMEFLVIMAHLVRKNPDWPEVSDMKVLLVNEDEEASIFNNILHIQQHRRLRALRRLATEGRHGHIKSTNIAHFLIPLIEHFIFDKGDDDGAHNLAAEAIMTIGALSEWLEWPQLRAMFRRFTGYIQSKPELEKTIIKLIGVTIESISAASVFRQKRQPSGSGLVDDENTKVTDDPPPSTLSLTLPNQHKFTDDLLNNLLPSLMSYLHDKDESTVSLRVPVAISVVKMLKTLPPDRLAERLPAVLTDVCHILRSRSQESRDLTRRTLVEISTLIGPSCFGFVLKELRSSLARGYQLHVLSFTVHSILVATAPIFKPGDLDYCLPQIVSVIMDDIFGATGQEKEAEEYVSKMKEVKSSKSYDSMELIAKTSSISHLLQLIRPLQTLLEEKLDMRMVKKIDELLRRVGVGLLRNDAAQNQQILVFCFEVLQDVYNKNNCGGERTTKEDHRVKRFLVLSKAKNTGRGSSSSYRYKLARFALDVLRSVLQKYNEMQTPSSLSGFMPIIENALLQAQEEVQISALRLLATIIKIPLSQIDDNASSYITEAVKIIRNTVSTNSEIAQAALKLVSAVLRERQNIDVRESDIAYLLKRLKPDLEEPDRQGVTFNFLKAIMTRKYMIPEVYEVLDTIATMMVTNQTKGARDLARGVYFQFILNYPQSKDRLNKQLGFLVKNLEYKHIEGRQSVMEAMHLLLSRVGDSLMQDLVGTFFVPLIMVIINDESADCRRMAGELLKELFEKADNERTRNVLAMLQKWFTQDEQKILIRVALQVHSIHLDSKAIKGEKAFPILQERITGLLKQGLEDESTTDWELQFYSLQTTMKMCQTFPNLVFQSSSAHLWTNVRKCLYYQHAWVKLAAAKLVGVYFADFARVNANKEQQKKSDDPLIGSYGLELGNEEMIQITKSSLGSLKIAGVSEELATQIARNLIFLGRFVGTSWMPQYLETQSREGNDAGEDMESDDGNTSDPAPTNSDKKMVLQYIFERLSAILRREPINTRAPALVSKTAALQIIASLCNHVSEPTLLSLTETILLPLHNLTDPSIPAPYSTDEGFRTSHKALVSTCHEIMSLLQKKLGTTEYVARLTRVRAGVKERREGRRVKRRLEAVAEPEKVGREKRRKGEKKKEKRKERSGEERGRRRGW